MDHDDDPVVARLVTILYMLQKWSSSFREVHNTLQACREAAALAF